jgi:hypothetical protein
MPITESEYSEFEGRVMTLYGAFLTSDEARESEANISSDCAASVQDRRQNKQCCALGSMSPASRQRPPVKPPTWAMARPRAECLSGELPPSVDGAQRLRRGQQNETSGTSDDSTGIGSGDVRALDPGGVCQQSGPALR